jgi:hypothetical protein
MTTTSGTVANIQIGVNLIDDYLYLAESPVAQDLSGCFVTVQNPNTTETGTGQASELLTVNGQGELVHYQPDNSSNSGWSQTVVPCSPPSYAPNLSATAAVIRRLVGFYDAAGILNALVYYDNAETSGAYSATWMQRSTSGEWSPAALDGNAENALGCTYQTNLFTDSDGNRYLYGVSANIGGGAFFLVAFNDDKENWEVIYDQALDEFLGNLSEQAAFQMAQGSGSGGAVVVLWVADDQIYYRNASITVGKLETTFQWTEATQPPYNPGVGTLTVQDVYALPAAYGENNLLVRNASGTLYLVQGYNEQKVSLLALTGTQTTQPEGVAAVAAGVDSRGVLTILGIDQDSDNLWYLQQQGTGAQLDPTSWVNLGGISLTIGCPTSMKVGPELFTVVQAQAGPTVYHMDQGLPAPSQNGNDGQSTQVWSTRKVAGPAPASSDPTNIASYSMELSLLDANGNPVGSTTDPNGIPVTVTADQATTIIWNSIAYHTDPNQSATIVADGSGQATVLYQAVGLKPPVITFSVTNSDQSTASRWCQGDIVEVKTGETQLTPAPGAVAPTLQTVQGQTLIDQNLTGSDYSNTDAANNAAAALNSAGGWMVTNAQDPQGTGSVDLSRVSVPHWQLDFTHPDGPRFRVLAADEARALLAKAEHPSTPPLLGGTLGDVFGDVAHFFKQEWQKLDSFAATVDQDVLKVVLTAEQGAQSFVISTVKQAGAALETIFSKIKEVAEDIYKVIEDVIAFLKMLFDWDDILNTHNVIKECVTQTLTNINNSLSYAETLVDEGFATLQAEVKKVFQDLESNFESIQGQSFNQFVDNTSGSQNTLAGTSTQNAQQQHASKCNYVYSRSLPSFSGPNAIALPSFFGAIGDADPTAPITNAVNQYIYSGDPNDQNTQTFNAGNAKLQDFVTGKITDPSVFFNLIIVDLLTAAEDIVLFIVDGIEFVINAALSIAASAIESFTSTVTATIDIPIITWLWKNVITDGDDLSILDLVCLIYAVPTTILYKLVGSKLLQPNEPIQAPFSSSDASTIKSVGLPWPAIPGQTAAGAQTLGSGSQLPSLLLANIYMSTGLFLTISAAITVYGDYLAWQSQQSEDDAPNPRATFVSWLSVIFRLFVFGTGAPVGVLQKPRDQWSDADQWTMWLWCTRGSAILVDTIFTAVSQKKAEAKWGPTYGPALRFTLAAGLEAVGSVAAYYQLKDSNYSSWVPANDWARPAAGLFKPMLYAKPDSVLWVPFPWLLGIDLVAGIGSSVTQIGATVYQYQHQS